MFHILFLLFRNYFSVKIYSGRWHNFAFKAFCLLCHFKLYSETLGKAVLRTLNTCLEPKNLRRARKNKTIEETIES